jgi:hypothetical protein
VVESATCKPDLDPKYLPTELMSQAVLLVYDNVYFALK